MKKILKKKTWIVVVLVIAAVLAVKYIPMISNYEQTLTGFVFRCDDKGNIIETEPVEEVTVELDVNRHKLLLSDERTLSGSISFSSYMKQVDEEEVLSASNVDYDVESRYAVRSLLSSEVKGSVDGRAAEKTGEGGQYLICTDLYYEDPEAYSTIIAYSDPEDVPVQREMRYSENFDKLVWIDYYNQYVYVCAEEQADAAQLLTYFGILQSESAVL